MKLFFVVVGLIVLAFGAGCLNYTTDGKTDHHREWAQKHELPPPSNRIFVLGLACTAAGAGVAGFALGRPRRR